MGRQSQQRVSNTKRAFQLASASSSKKKKGPQQLTLVGGFAFDSERDCVICKAYVMKSLQDSYRIPKRSHHVLCAKNSKTLGKGDFSKQMTAVNAEERRLKQLFNAPLELHEKAAAGNTTKAGAALFFAERKAVSKTTTTTTAAASPSPINFSNAGAAMTADVVFQEKHKNKRVPLAMLAFAEEFVDKILRPSKGNPLLLDDMLDGLAVTVPPACGSRSAQYHSIAGQKLLLVDWPKTHGIEVPCPGRPLLWQARWYCMYQVFRGTISRGKDPIMGLLDVT